MLLRAIAVVCCLVLAACQTATTPPEPLPPRSFDFAAPKAKVKEAVATVYLSAGYQLVRDSDLQIVFDKPAKDSFVAQFLFGSEWNSVPNARMSLTFLGDNPTNVTVNIQIVTNPGTGLERITDLTDNREARAAAGQRMDQVRNALTATSPAPGKTAAKK